MTSDEQKFQEWVDHLPNKLDEDGRLSNYDHGDLELGYHARDDEIATLCAQIADLEQRLANARQQAFIEASKIAYSVNNHDEHMQWVIPTGPNSDRCGWCACLETIANKLNPDPDFGKDGYVPGVHDNEVEIGGEK